MRTSWQVLVALVAVATLGCASHGADVSSTFGPDVDFKKYETWAFVPVESPRTGDPRLDDPRLANMIEAAITRHLNDRGFRFVADDPDMLINYSTAINRGFDDLEMQNREYGHGSGITRDVEFETGSIAIIIFDAKDGKGVWGASMNAELDEKASREQRRTRLDKVLNEMFSKFTKEEYLKHKEAEAAGK